jgi:hypothetical protein
MIITLISLGNTGCKKDPPENSRSNTAPIAYAGGDVFVWSPLSESELNGSYSDYENDVKEVSWAKISGPNSYVLENKNSPHTKISGLEKGVYEFELTVTDKMNLYDKDTVVVTAGEIPVSPNEIIFRDLAWIFPWYNNIEIENFASNIPPGSMFKIFIQREYDPEWKEVPPENVYGLYDYFIITGPHDFYRNGSLYVTYYGFDVDDTPDVKIVF